MNRIINLIFVLLLTQILAQAQPVADHGQLKVVGTQLQNANGEAVILRGMSFGWHNWWPRFYTEETVSWLKSDWKVTAVRAAMGVEPDGAYLTDSAFAVEKVKTVVDAAIGEGIYVIIDWHSHNINLEEAKAFFKLMAETYGDYPNIIYEIFNEPDDESWSEVKAYSIELIETIRAIDSNNIILVGSPNYDQDLHLVAADPIIGQTNIMYTMHFYAATHGKWLRDRCDDAIEAGIPIFISESAGCESSGDGPIDNEAWEEYIDWMESKQLSWFCWSISDKDETCSVLKQSASSTGGWVSDDLTESGQQCRDLFSKYHYSYEPARIYKAMAKGRRGENLKIGVIGGSITQGYAASSDNKRWSNLMADWWEEKFPTSSVSLINAGWGGTGSDIGVHRAYDDLLKQNPDFIVIEFSVNDSKGELATKMMEGLIQQIISAESDPGMMILMLKQDNGTTAQESHKPVGEYYNVPLVSFADLIDAKVAEDGVDLSSIFVDGLHPNDAGMAYIAGFLKERLDTIYSTLPPDNDLPPINNKLPVPLVTDTYSNTYQFFNDNIIPLSNDGWVNSGRGWSTETSGNQIDYQLSGNAISIIFTQNDNANRGKAEVWVDNGPKTIIDAYMNEDWGTRYAFALIQEGLDDSQHILHVKSIAESSTGGNVVEISRVLVAGNIGSAQPIAKTSDFQKGAVDIEVLLDASESYDPDGEDVNGYLWSLDQKPSGSSATIINNSEVTGSLTPDLTGEYKISLVVSAGFNQSVPTYKTIMVRESNTVPVAIAGNDTMSALNKFFTLNGTQSYDDDDDLITYKWLMESKPDGSESYVLIEDYPITQCRFDLEGDYLISLEVSDSIEVSDKSYITVTAKEGYSKLIESQELNHSFKIFPNPGVDVVTLQFELKEKSTYSIEIYSTAGTKITEITKQTGIIGMNSISLPIKSLVPSPGSYFITIVTDDVNYVSPFNLI